MMRDARLVWALIRLAKAADVFAADQGGATDPQSNELRNALAEAWDVIERGGGIADGPVRRMKQHLGPHCAVGSYDHQVPQAVRGRVVYVDYCIAAIVAALNAAGIETVASCCGHGEFPGSVCLADGRRVIVCEKDVFDKLFVVWGEKLAASRERGGA